jgi:hypothetical protein
MSISNRSSPAAKTHPKKLLIITSSGGGGLLQTANAKEQEALAKNPHLTIARRDFLKDWAPLKFFSVKAWNNAQRGGKVVTQMVWIRCQRAWDFLIFPIIFFQALRTLYKEEVDHIIDTQNMGTSAIIRALRVYNWKKKKRIIVEKVLVDLPTKKATHFFHPIKKLSKKNRRLLLLTSIAPLLEEGETAEDFWQATCGLSAKEVNLEEVYVRQAFHKYKGKGRADQPIQIKIKTKGREEMQLMRSAFEKGPIPAQVRGNEVDFRIDPEDRVFTILLGSQPATVATLNYVKKLSQIAKEHPNTKTHIFVFCADHIDGEKDLFAQVAQFAAQVKEYPKNLSIIPFSFQNENVIAPLFHRSDITCTRSGGQTAMELMCVSTGEILIHSEAKPGQDLLKGIPGWEAASALYLRKLKGAKIVTPDSIVSHARALYQIDTQQALANRPLASNG